MNKIKFLAILFASSLAGAQTVTVGTLTTAQNGVTTTITVPVSVAAAAVTDVKTTPRFSLDVSTLDGATTLQNIGNGFTTVSLPNVITDTASAWNPTSNAYVIPATGMYLIVSHVRLVDGAPAGVSYGVGVDTANRDSPTFAWTTTNAYRNGFSDSRVAYFIAGTPVDLFVYVDSAKPIGVIAASLNIQQLP
ncbi:MAG: hypothetical protein ABI380_13100 [Edaphobacter sp.]